jgi:hypothetical protein
MEVKYFIELFEDNQKITMNAIESFNLSECTVKNLWTLESYTDVYSNDNKIKYNIDEFDYRDNVITDLNSSENLLKDFNTIEEHLQYIEDINITSVTNSFILHSIKTKKIPLLETKEDLLDYLNSLMYSMKKIKS